MSSSRIQCVSCHSSFLPHHHLHLHHHLGWINISPQSYAVFFSSITVPVQRGWSRKEVQTDNYRNKGMTDRREALIELKLSFWIDHSVNLRINIVPFSPSALPPMRKMILNLSYGFWLAAALHFSHFFFLFVALKLFLSCQFEQLSLRCQNLFISKVKYLESMLITVWTYVHSHKMYLEEVQRSIYFLFEGSIHEIVKLFQSKLVIKFIIHNM